MSNADLDSFIAERVMGIRHTLRFQPTTVISDMYLLLNKLREKHTAKIWMGKDNWRVALAHGGISVSAWADTLPMAICKAAQAAVEAKGMPTSTIATDAGRATTENDVEAGR